MRVSCKEKRSGSKGCPSIGAYVSSFAANSDWISSDFMVGRRINRSKSSYIEELLDVGNEWLDY